MSETGTPATPRRRWTRGALIAAAAVAVLGVGAIGLARAAATGPSAFGHFGHGCFRKGLAKDFAEFRLQKALEAVNASDAQQKQILAILDGVIARHEASAPVREQLHEQILGALTGATVDRAALEAARADAVSRIDTCSRDLAKSLGDMAEALTPAQRQQLAALAAAHRQ